MMRRFLEQRCHDDRILPTCWLHRPPKCTAIAIIELSQTKVKLLTNRITSVYEKCKPVKEKRWSLPERYDGKLPGNEMMTAPNDERHALLTVVKRDSWQMTDKNPDWCQDFGEYYRCVGNHVKSWVGQRWWVSDGAGAKRVTSGRQRALHAQRSSRAGSGQRKSFASGNYGFIRLIVYTLCHHQNTNKIYTAFTNRFRHALHSIQELFKTITDLLHNSSDAKQNWDAVEARCQQESMDVSRLHNVSTALWKTTRWVGWACTLVRPAQSSVGGWPPNCEKVPAAAAGPTPVSFLIDWVVHNTHCVKEWSAVGRERGEGMGWEVRFDQGWGKR